MLKLTLKNYRRFEVAEADFRAGLTIVTGPNGAGKTTLVEAIAYALFGPRPGRGGGGVRSDNASGDAVVEVSCSFEVDGHDVVVQRSGPVAALWLDGTQQVTAAPGSVRQVNQYLGRLLGGLTREQFEKVYIAEQGQTAGLVSDKPAERKRVLEVALQLDVLQEVRTLQAAERNDRLAELKAEGNLALDMLGLAAEERASFDNFRSALQPQTRHRHLDAFLFQVKGAVNRLQEGYEKAQGMLEEATAAVARAEAAIVERAKAVSRAEATLTEHEERYRAVDTYREPIAQQEGRQAEAAEAVRAKEQEIAPALAAASAARRYRSTQETLRAVERRLDLLFHVKGRWEAFTQAIHDVRSLERQISDLGDLQADLGRAAEKEADARAHWKALQADPTAEDAVGLERRVGELGLYEQQATAALDALQQSNRDARCPTCDQSLDAHARQERQAHLEVWLTDVLPRLHRELREGKDELDGRRREWQAKREAAQRAWENAKTAVSAVRSRADWLHQCRSQLERAEGRLGKARAAWRELGEAQRWDLREQANLTARAKRLAARSTQLQAAADRFASLDRLRAELEEERQKEWLASQEVERLRREQATIGYDRAAHTAVAGRVDTTRAELEAAKEWFRDVEQIARERENQSKQARETVSRGAAEQARFQEAAAAWSREERLHILLSDFYVHFFAQNTTEIARRASELIRPAMSDGSILGVQFEEDGDPMYLDASHARQPVSRLSGGEKALVGLCLRIAVAEHALRLARSGRLRFLVLDEVLSSLDDERREAMQRVFDDVQRNGVFDHIVMITHLEAVRHAWHGTRLEIGKVGAKTSQVLIASADGAVTEELVDVEEAERTQVLHA